MSANTIHLEKFNGPLDLLLNLISKNEIDIYDIPIEEITRQYMDYIYTMNKLNIELASEFIVMAAQLIEIKSRLLVPSAEITEPEIDPREELVKRLVEYKTYKQISLYLKRRETLSQKRITKDPAFYPGLCENAQDPDISAQLLARAMRRILVRHEVTVESVVSSYTIDTESVHVKDKIKYIENLLETKDKLMFNSLFKVRQFQTRKHIVTSFLAILEMVKLNIIKISQDCPFDDILIIKL